MNTAACRRLGSLGGVSHTTWRCVAAAAASASIDTARRGTVWCTVASASFCSGRSGSLGCSVSRPIFRTTGCSGSSDSSQRRCRARRSRRSNASPRPVRCYFLYYFAVAWPQAHVRTNSCITLGDILYIPESWHHATLNVADTVGVAVNHLPQSWEESRTVPPEEYHWEVAPRDALSETAAADALDGEAQQGTSLCAILFAPIRRDSLFDCVARQAWM